MQYSYYVLSLAQSRFLSILLLLWKHRLRMRSAEFRCDLHAFTVWRSDLIDNIEKQHSCGTYERVNTYPFAVPGAPWSLGAEQRSKCATHEFPLQSGTKRTARW